MNSLILFAQEASIESEGIPLTSILTVLLIILVILAIVYIAGRIR